MAHPQNRSERRFQRERVVHNRLKLVIAFEEPNKWGVFKRLIPNTINRRAGARGFWYEHPGRFHKKKPYDCGRAGCPHCHFTKFNDPKQKRIEEKLETRRLLEDSE